MGTQALICSLVFSFGKFPVSGGRASSCVTIVVLMVLSLEMGGHRARKLAVAPAEPSAAPGRPRRKELSRERQAA
jgi:hypothetical protein